MVPPSPPKPTDPSEFKPPVKWLLGPQVIASLRSIGLFTLFGSKLDARDWMVSSVEPFAAEGAKEFWFDYMADTGDGQMAAYSMAYLCLSDLEAKEGLVADAPVGLVPPGQKPSGEPLPRGAFLVVGGDTAYPVATYAALAERFQKPFCRAATSLGIDDESPRRPLFGLPGNHDYYDSIDGFNRQFRRPLRGDEVTSSQGPGVSFPEPQLRIPGFERRQTASYFALQLPFDWWLWGVDNEIGHGDVDIRQQNFFRARDIPQKLIVATPEPSTVQGRLPDEGHKVSRAFKRLGLPRPFLGEPLEPTQCRLDISGDIHHYARYWGPSAPGHPQAESSDFYASVVAGGGGAFLHPSHGLSQEIREQALYPSSASSRREIADGLFDPRRIWKGGYVWVIGGFLAAVVYVSSLTEDSRPIVEPILRSIARPGALDLPGHVFESDPADVLERVGSFDSSGFGAALLASVALAILAYAVAWVRAKTRHGKSEEASPHFTTLFGIVSLSIFGAGLFLFSWDGRESIFPALLRFLAAGWSILSLALAVFHAEWLFKLTRKREISGKDYRPVAALVALAALVPAVTLHRVGGVLPAARLGLDTIIVATLLAGGVGIVVVGAMAPSKRAGWIGRIGHTLLGLCHAGCQLGLPLFLARLGNLASLAAAACLTLIFSEIGRRLAASGKRWWLIVAWLAYAIVVTLCATLLPAVVPFGIAIPAGWNSWATGILATLLGAVMSCVSLGWYLAVAIGFSGHVTVPGAAAPTERFKQFIRFRITQESLTGFVIAIDDPKPEGKELEPRLIDVFTLQSRAPSRAAEQHSSADEQQPRAVECIS